MSILFEKLQIIQSANSKEEAFQIIIALVADYGYDNGIYTLMTDHPSIGLSANDGLTTAIGGDWRDHYRAKGYRDVGAIWGRLRASSVPFFWADLIDEIERDTDISDERRNKALQVFNESADAGLTDGIAISFVSPAGEIAGFSLARRSPEQRRSHKELAEISLMTATFHEKFLSFHDRPEAPRLTPREREVLLWAADGRSDYDISCILNVSASAIRFHWGNIFGKLSVKGRLRAVVKAMQLGIITPQLINQP